MFTIVNTLRFSSYIVFKVMPKTKTRKTEIFRVRLTPWQLAKLQSYAENHGKSASAVICDYIHRLPVQGDLKLVNTELEAS